MSFFFSFLFELSNHHGYEIPSRIALIFRLIKRGKANKFTYV